MDLSAFIFVALAVAWAVYLVPKALKHHDDVVRSRSVDRFSHTMRVLARREPVDRRNARLVVTPGRAASTPIVTTKASAPSMTAGMTAGMTSGRLSSATDSPALIRRRAQARREAARLAARRRRRVLGSLLLANLTLVALAATSIIGWVWLTVTAALVVAWLVACRLMVKAERADAVIVEVDVAGPVAAPAPVAAPDAATPTTAAPTATGHLQDASVPSSMEDTSHMDAVSVEAVDPTLWDPVPVTLPTYVTKPMATRRTVRTIDLDDTGVWTSGNTAGDSQLARDAEMADRADQTTRSAGESHRAVGS